MMPALKPNAWQILTRAWSVLLWALGLLFIVLDTALPFLQATMGLPDWAFGLASGVCGAGGIIARVLIQSNLTDG